MKRLLLGTLLLLGVTMGCDKDEPDTDKGKTTAASSAATATAKADATATPPAAGPAGASTGGATAHTHLGTGCEVVIRIDVASLLDDATVKAEIVPAIEQVRSAEPKDDGGKRLKAFLAETGIDPLKDIKEVAMCVTDIKAATDRRGEPSFAVILSGNLKPGTVIPAVIKHAKKDTKLTEVEIAGTKALTDEKAVMYVAQASDGAVVVAKGKALLEAALPSSEAFKSHGLPLDKALSLVVTADTMKMLMGQGGQQNPFAAQAGKVGRATLVVDLAARTVEQRIGMADEKSATELAGAVKMIVAQMAKAPAQPGDPSAMVAAIVKDAKIEASGKDLVIGITVPAEQVTAGAKQLAKQISKDAGKR